ncbi:putative ABC transporter, substrate-binding protein [Desulfonema limicola]|uniref:ABC transporter, substrate-binding protein n=1 Tax=Desulfonema limicola TaxID=45656 RepID=A0A975B9U1_9BACT|nr:ABC transporter substrate-binding protein [Desulfonema limicola]QTA81336.1 putative ABC transporter, substrate-binding protein [Desulfonema limicola]
MNKIIIICLYVLFLCFPVFADKIKDDSGNEINVDKPFKRIISLYGAHTENLFSLGLDKEIIGVSKNESYPPKALEKPVFSYHDDAEKFMAARPDLVLVRPMIARVYQPFIKKLEQAGIIVVSLQPVGIEDMYNYWQNLGILTGREQAAAFMIKEFGDAVEDFKKQAGQIPYEKRKKVYFEAIHQKMKTFAAHSTAMFVLLTAGGINIAEHASQMRQTNIAAFGKERILAKAGEIDVFIAQQGTMNPVSVEIIKNEPGFHVIKAVYNNQVYMVDELIVSRPTMRLLEGIQKIAEILYPEIMQDKLSKRLPPK